MPMDRPDLPVGETVAVKIPAAAVVQSAPLVVKVGTEEVIVPTDSEVDVVNPLSWPPAAGDVWRGAGDTLWFGLIVMVQGEPKVRLIPASGGNPQVPNQVKADHRPLTLVFRA